MGNRLRKIGIVFGVLVLLVLLGVYFRSHDDSDSSYEYATYADLAADTKVQAAAVPDFVPPSARDIVGLYSVELDDQRLEFTFDPQDQASITRGFQRVSQPEAGHIAGKLRGLRWKKGFSSTAPAEVFERRSGDVMTQLLVNGDRAYVYIARLQEPAAPMKR